MFKSCLVICALALMCCGCTKLFARTTQLKKDKQQSFELPKKGLMVTEVFDNSPAQGIGIKPGDVVTNYGKYEIIDEAKFFEAKNYYESNHVPQVEIVVFRNTSRMTATVPSGWLGVHSIDADPQSQLFAAYMQRVDVLSATWEYRVQKDTRTVQEVNQALSEARKVVDVSEERGLMTPTQILLSRIYLTLDSATEEEKQQQVEFLKQLIATQPTNFIHMLTIDKYWKQKRNNAAIFCFKHLLKIDPTDVSNRLNLAVTYNRAGMYAEANEEVAYVFEKLEYSDYGELVGNQAKSISALGRRDYVTAYEYGEKAFNYSKRTFDAFLSLLAAAQLGDSARYSRILERLKTTVPAEYERMKFPIASSQALLMVKAGRKNEAIAFARQWQAESSKGHLFEAWRDLPDGTDVATNWNDLIKS